MWFVSTPGNFPVYFLFSIQRNPVFCPDRCTTPCITNHVVQWTLSSYSYAMCIFIYCSRKLMELFELGFVSCLFLFRTQSICKCAFRENAQHFENCLWNWLWTVAVQHTTRNNNNNNRTSNTKSVIRFIDRWISLETK